MVTSESTDIAIIGAGISGLTAASKLASSASVIVVEKSRGPSGRMSTRRDGDSTFDHGAQYFTARSAEFRETVQRWVDRGVVSRWDGRFIEIDGSAIVDCKATERFVGVPTMSAIGRSLASELDVRYGARVTDVKNRDGIWVLTCDTGLMVEAQTLVVATPAAQANALIESAAFETKTDPCWAVMLTFDQDPDVDFHGAIVRDSPIAWIADDGAKPQRPDGHRWVVHASPTWSEEHLEDSPDIVAGTLVSELRSLFDIPKPVRAVAHRWRFARVSESLGQSFVYNSSRNLGFCGDWCLGPRVEAAWTSGSKLADEILT